MGKGPLLWLVAGCVWAVPLHAQTPPSAPITLTASVSAKVERLNVQPGQRVQAGDLLVTFACPVQRAQLAEARAYVSAAARRRELRTLTADNPQQAEAEYQKAQAHQIQTEHSLTRCRILSPTDGTVLHTQVHEQQPVETGHAIIIMSPEPAFR